MFFQNLCFGLILFRAETLGQAWGYFCGICDVSLFTIPWLNLRSYYLPVVISIFTLLVVEWIQRDKEHAFDLSGIKSRVLRFAIYYLVVIALFWFGGQAETFIYFQF